MAPQIYVSVAVEESLATATIELQNYFAEQGHRYSPEEIQGCLVKWLELSLEELAADAFYHCTGDRLYAFNRSDFNRALQKLEKIRADRRVSDRYCQLAA